MHLLGVLSNHRLERVNKGWLRKSTTGAELDKNSTIYLQKLQ